MVHAVKTMSYIIVIFHYATVFSRDRPVMVRNAMKSLLRVLLKRACHGFLRCLRTREDKTRGGNRYGVRSF